MLTALNKKACSFFWTTFAVTLLLSNQSIVYTKHTYPTTRWTNSTSDYDDHKNRPKTYKNDLLPITPKPTYDPIKKIVLKKISIAEFQDMFQNTSNQDF